MSAVLTAENQSNTSLSKHPPYQVRVFYLFSNLCLEPCSRNPPPAADSGVVIDTADGVHTDDL